MCTPSAQRMEECSFILISKGWWVIPALLRNELHQKNKTAKPFVMCVFLLTLHFCRAVFGTHPIAAAYLLPLVFFHVCTKTLPDFPVEYLNRWLWIWSGWVGGCLVYARPLLWDIEVTMRQEFFWEEIIKLQTLKMRLLLWPRQPYLFLLTAALCSLIAIIEAIIASCKMTFPLVLWRGQASLCCIPSLSLSLFLSAALYDASNHVFVHGRDGKDVCEHSGKSLTLLYT